VYFNSNNEFKFQSVHVGVHVNCTDYRNIHFVWLFEQNIEVSGNHWTPG